MVHILPIEQNDLKEQSARFKELLLMCALSNFPHSKYIDDYVNTTFDRLLQYHADGTAIVYGAFNEATLVGFLWAYKRMFLGEMRIHIRELVVDSAYRRCGIGKKLISSLLELAKERKIDVVELLTSKSNPNAISFYESIGFVCERVQMEMKSGG